MNQGFNVATKQSDEWQTPRWVFDALDSEFGFTLDGAATDANRLCKRFTGAELGVQVWQGERVFCNPPYGPGLTQWLVRGLEASLAVFLIPARTDTQWFHEIVLPRAEEIRFIKGRLKFGDAKNSAPFPSMLVIFKREAASPPQTGAGK